MWTRLSTILVVAALSLACGGADLDGVFQQYSADPFAGAPPEPPVQTPSAPEPAAPKVTLSVDDFVLGGSSDDRVIVQYSDWRCPHCMVAFPKVEAYARSVDAQLRFRNFPLSAPCNPAIERETGDRCALALGSVCAHQQERFTEWFQAVDTAPDEALETFRSSSAFRACMEDPETAARVARQAASGTELQLRGTPTFFLREDGVWRSGDLATLDGWFETD